MKKIILVVILVSLALIIIPNITYAGFLDSLECLNDQDQMCNLRDMTTSLDSLISLLFGAAGAIALLFFVYGGVWWLVSGGNADRVKRGRDIMIGTVTALFIIFSSALVVNFYIQDILKVSTEEIEEEVGSCGGFENNTVVGLDTGSCLELTANLSNILECAYSEVERINLNLSLMDIIPPSNVTLQGGDADILKINQTAAYINSSCSGNATVEGPLPDYTMLITIY